MALQGAMNVFTRSLLRTPGIASGIGKRLITLHVVGRTYGGDPRTYYYRQFVENRRWTPWTKIDQDIAIPQVEVD